jgi:hypothetical protein
LGSSNHSAPDADAGVVDAAAEQEDTHRERQKRPCTVVRREVVTTQQQGCHAAEKQDRGGCEAKPVLDAERIRQVQAIARGTEFKRHRGLRATSFD